MAKIALVTGATGQDGRYLVDLLLANRYVVHAQSRRAPPPGAADGVRWHIGDLTSSAFLEQLIVDTRPDEIYNLAAVSRPIMSWQFPRETADVNAFLPQNICELLLKHKPDCRLFQASSSDIFGDGFSERQNEQTHCVPKSPYAVAKLYGHRIIGAYRKQYGLHACSGILFNHESPYRPLSFVSQKIAYAAAAAACGLKDTPELDERGRPILSDGKLLLGDLGVRRDFGFAGDYAEVMHMVLQHPTADDYVIGTGEDHSIQEFCELAFRSVGLDWTDYVSVDPKLIRKTDSHYTHADPAKLRSVFNWHPKVTFPELVSTMVEMQVKRVRDDIALERSRNSVTKRI
ncbi:GDP-mannose 4,6-dehydratase [Bradyrhizobium sp. Leo121]|uniref:GDP-mannose 4,6-dehydratase n=1 Tax=Bradyrhizobium sp. Leo121 TaxID=1571195 RepID=UPI0010293B3B|nr:GDP-mannose 4,6-dehydratase [Bradyrhizobium sp. Leo121]RZN35324.1 GDP-mannose 4,6-dehydratase [Bradyrhizobium sp. Leo121]